MANFQNLSVAIARRVALDWSHVMRSSVDPRSIILALSKFPDDSNFAHSQKSSLKRQRRVKSCCRLAKVPESIHLVHMGLGF